MYTSLLLGLKDAAASLGLSHWTLRDWIRRGKLHAVRLGRRVLVEPAELERLVAAGRNGADNNEHTISDHRA
jgi:excisionase family DNA binding protein